MSRKSFLCLFFVFFTMVFISSGCGYKSIKHGTEITEQQTSIIVDGETTKQKVLMEFGEPSKTMDNEKVFFYTWTRGGKGHIIGFGSGSAKSKSLVIVFDENGIVQSHKITRGATSGGATVGD